MYSVIVQTVMYSVPVCDLPLYSLVLELVHRVACRRSSCYLYRYFARYLGRFACEKVQFRRCAAVFVTVRRAATKADMTALCVAQCLKKHKVSDVRPAQLRHDGRAH